MSAKTGDVGVSEDSGAGTQQEQNRSKRVPKKQRGGARASLASAYQQAEPVIVSQQQSEFVRVLKVDTRKTAVEAGEDLNTVLLSRTGKAALTLSEDRLSVTGTKGFRTVRATHGAYVGTYYCEVTVTSLGKTGHARLGWCTRKAELQAPVGFDQFGYCYRDLEGSKVHRGKREPYGEAFGEGDVIGMLIHLPPGGRPLEAQHRPVARFKGAICYVDENEPKPEPVPGSFVAFTRNGNLQGVAHSDLLEGTYYPAASLYTLPEQTEGATVTFNFGPDFKHSPPQLESCPMPQPVTELAVKMSGPTEPPTIGGTLTELTAEMAKAQKGKEAKDKEEKETEEREAKEKEAKEEKEKEEREAKEKEREEKEVKEREGEVVEREAEKGGMQMEEVKALEATRAEAAAEVGEAAASAPMAVEEQA